MPDELGRTITQIPFDDIDALQQQITEELGEPSAELVVTQEMINEYAQLTGDNQWLHTDTLRAQRESPYGATIAQGFLLLGLMPKLHPPNAFEVVKQKGVLNYGSNGLRFLAPVVVNSSIRSRQRLIAVDRHRRGPLLTSEVIMEQADSNEVALNYGLQLLYF